MHAPGDGAAAAGKHVFCEKPFTLTKKDAEAAVGAVRKAGVTLGLGYNRRFHPEMVRLRDRIRSGGLGTILHIEATMTFPNALYLKQNAWRAHKDDTPAGGLTPMGVHAVDGMIDLCGAIDHVYCQSFRRVVEIEADDTTSILFRMKDGSSGYLGTMTATGPGFSFQVFGSKGWVRLEGLTRCRRSSDEQRTRSVRHLQVPAVEGRRGNLAGATRRQPLGSKPSRRRQGGHLPITLEEMIHGSAVTEAIVRSATSGNVEKVS